MTLPIDTPADELDRTIAKIRGRRDAAFWKLKNLPNRMGDEAKDLAAVCVAQTLLLNALEDARDGH